LALNLRFVKEIHARLSVRYGTAWSAKWAGLNMEAIEADWADQLDGMKPEGIKKALASLPEDFPPTAPGFRSLGMIRDEAAPAIALPPPDPVGLRRIASSLAPIVNHQEPPSEWMARLDRDVKAGNANPARKRHHAIATANGYYGNTAAATMGDFVPPAESSLPPGMRAAA
jgi:hypothetical protein